MERVVKLTVVVKGIKVGQRVDFAEGLLIDHFPAPTKYRTHKRKVTTITPPQFSFLSELTLNDAFFAKFPIKGAYRSMVLIHTMFVVALINLDFFCARYAA